MGNLGSVVNACRFLELPAEIVAAPDGFSQCRALILPGVGAFGDCVRNLDTRGFTEPLRAWIEADRPLLGICLGLQLLFENSEESPGVPGLGILRGTVRRLPARPGYKIPHMGWNEVEIRRPGPLFADLPSRFHAYFVHTFFVDPADPACVAAETDYTRRYACAVQRGRLAAVQFHPEKSHQAGLTLLRNFARANS